MKIFLQVLFDGSLEVVVDSLFYPIKSYLILVQ